VKLGGSVRGAFAGFLGLVALHAVAQKGSSKRVGGAFSDLAAIVERVLDADVPAIPDHSKPSKPSTAVADGAAAAADPPRLPIPAPPK
jgi:hypothetical protein